MDPTPTEAPGTVALLARACNGDAAAGDELFAAAAARVLLYVRVRLGPQLRLQVEPEDVLQDVLAEALATLDRFEPRGPGSFVRWCCAIAEHRLCALADHRRAKQRRPSADVERVSKILGRVASGSVGPASAAARRDEAARLETALLALDEAERDAILLRFFQALPIREVAERLGRSTSATQRLLGRGIERLGGALEVAS